MKLKKIFAVLMAAAMMIPLASCGNKSDDPVVFTVGDQTVTKSEFEAYMATYTSNNYSFDDAKEYAKTDATNNAAMSAVVSAKGLKYTDDEKQAMKDQKDKIISAQGGQSKYNDFLGTLGVTDEYVDKMIEAQYAQDKLFSDDISQDAEKDYFNKNYYRAKHVLIATMDPSTQKAYDATKKAEQKTLSDSILERAKSGEDFDSLVSQYSEDPGSKSNPDGYYFTSGQMVQEFENAVTSAKENEITFCESSYGYHIIKRLPLEEGSDAYNKAFSNAEQTIKTTLIQKVVDEKLPELLKENNLEVKTDDEVYNSITESTSKTSSTNSPSGSTSK